MATTSNFTSALARVSSFAKAAPFFKNRASKAAELAVDETLERLLGESYAARVARMPLHLGDAGVDPFGFDPQFAKYALLWVAWMHRKYFRSEVFGIENVPKGAMLLISNHSGQVPIDGMMIGASMFMDAEPPRIVRAMVEKWASTLPFISLFFSRVGQVTGVPENARRLLEQGEALLVFPEGSRGISKPFDQRYQLTEFGLGFMRLAMETNTPIVPVAIVGAEEQFISIANVERLAKLLRMPAFPIIPQWFIPGGQFPLPTRYRIYFGKPLTFTGDADEEDGAIEERVQSVKQTIQSMLNRGTKERKHIFW